MRKQFKVAVLGGLLLLGALPALAGPPRHFPRGEGGSARDFSEFRLRMGLFTPAGDSKFWDDNKIDFTGDAKDLKAANFGADYLWPINRNASLRFSVDYFSGDNVQSYRELTEGGQPIRHTSTLDIMPLTAGFVFYPAGRNQPVTPYLGIGAGLYWWEYREHGDFVIMNTGEIISESYQGDSVAGGIYLCAGLDIPINPNLGFFVEGRWQKVTDTMNKDFEDFGKIDLGGTTIEGGLSFRF